jgi:hypothetical protein
MSGVAAFNQAGRYVLCVCARRSVQPGTGSQHLVPPWTVGIGPRPDAKVVALMNGRAALNYQLEAAAVFRMPPRDAFMALTSSCTVSGEASGS